MTYRSLLIGLTLPLFLSGCGVSSLGTVSNVVSIASSYIAIRDYMDSEPDEEAQADQPNLSIHKQSTLAMQQDSKLPSTPKQPDRYYYGPLQNYYAYPLPAE